MKIIAFVNQKGGVGKTTTVINTGDGLARLGQNVLLVDMDPQANCTEGVGVDPDQVKASLYEVLMGDTRISEIMLQIKEGLFLAPACIDLAGAEVELLQLPGKDIRLQKILAEAGDFDYVLIDCPPSLGQLTVNALTAADEVYIPLQCQFFSLKGVQKLLNTISMVQKWSNKKLKVGGVISTMFDGRKNLHKDVRDQVHEHFQEVAFETVIPMNAALENAPAAGVSVTDYDASSAGAKAYNALCQEILARKGTKNV